MNWKTAGRQVELVGKMAQFTSDMVEKTTVVLRVGSVVLHPGTSLKKGPIGLSEVIFVDSGIFLQTPSRNFHMLLDAETKRRSFLGWNYES